MKKIVTFIIGAPCAGKTTLRNFLCEEIKKWPDAEKMQIQSFSIGDLLRQKAEEQTETGRQIKERTDKGLFTPCETWVPLLRERLEDESKIIIMDGYLSGKAALKAFCGLTEKYDTFIIRRQTPLPLIFERERLSRRQRNLQHRKDTDNFYSRLEEYLRFSTPLWPKIRKIFKERAISFSGRREAREVAVELSGLLQTFLKE